MISFIHSGDASMASYRYRVEIPSRLLNTKINDLSADIVVFSKPAKEDVQAARAIQLSGRKVIADFCDDHFDQEHYRELALIADELVCPTETMAGEIAHHVFRQAAIIPDPYEFPEEEPHCNGVNLLWFGHGSNLPGLLKVIRTLDDYPLMIVSNHPMAMPWSHGEMLSQFALADIVILPKTADYKSPNRAIEAVRQGCFVVAEPHPSLADIPVWQGNIKEGIEWARLNPRLANIKTLECQNFIRERYSPKTQATAWKNLFEKVKSRSTSALARRAGPVGPRSMRQEAM